MPADVNPCAAALACSYATAAVLLSWLNWRAARKQKQAARRWAGTAHLAAESAARSAADATEALADCATQAAHARQSAEDAARAGEPVTLKFTRPAEGFPRLHQPAKDERRG